MIRKQNRTHSDDQKPNKSETKARSSLEMGKTFICYNISKQPVGTTAPTMLHVLLQEGLEGSDYYSGRDHCISGGSER